MFYTSLVSLVLQFVNYIVVVFKAINNVYHLWYCISALLHEICGMIYSKCYVVNVTVSSAKYDVPLVRGFDC